MKKVEKGKKRNIVILKRGSMRVTGPGKYDKFSKGNRKLVYKNIIQI